MCAVVHLRPKAFLFPYDLTFILNNPFWARERERERERERDFRDG
jgi:hypothetical protein